MKTDEIKQRIREVGLRVTISRMAVLKHILLAERPLSHGDLVCSLDGNGGDQATIYRCLITFVELGLLRVASRANGIARYEPKPKNEPLHRHPHFVCEICGIVSCLPSVTVTNPVGEPWPEILQNAALQFLGECELCLRAS